MIHYSQDILLNSKNEYNANCLARVKVDESKYEQKSRERLEASEEAKEKEAWANFKNMKAGFRKRKEKDDTPDVPRAKKPRIEQAPHSEVADLGDWLGMTEDVCQRAGELKKYLDMDKQRMLRRMETFGEDQILTDIWPMWEEKLPCGWIEGRDENSIPDGGKPEGAGHPFNKPHSRDPSEGEDDAELQSGGEEDEKSIEVVASTNRMETFEEDLILADVRPMWEEKLPCGWKEAKDEDPIPDNGKHSGAGYPVTTPHSRDPGEGGGDDQPEQEFGKQELSKLNKHPTGRRKSTSRTCKRDTPPTWWESLVGLVGWWRRLELENEKDESKRRKLEEDRRRKEANKLEFLRKFYPNISTTPGGSERLRSGKSNLNILGHPTDCNKFAELSLSPHTKRNVGGGELIGNIYSPAKKLKFTEFPLTPIGVLAPVSAQRDTPLSSPSTSAEISLSFLF
jgi:hypothetical protein